MTPVTNMPASIHQRLLNKANNERRPFNELLQYYAIERFLYRLGQSPHNESFVLKGALVFLAWQTPLSRPTRDIDFLGFTKNSTDNLVFIVQEICRQPVEEDGMFFDPTSAEGEVIKEDADYQGVRVHFVGRLGHAKTHLRLDVGFADIVTPAPAVLELPALLEEMDCPHVRAYPPETVLAEKFHAMTTLGMINGRLKDFYDIWFIVKQMEFDIRILQAAIANTYNCRKSIVPTHYPSALSEEFAAQKQAQWLSFLKKSRIVDAPEDLLDVILTLRNFAEPLFIPHEKPCAHWFPKTGWVE